MTRFRPAIIHCLKELTPTRLLQDTAAGISVGFIALPLAMAFAIASGVAPERGLFTAIVAGVLISLLGGSRTQIGGPTGAFVVIVSGIAAQYGYHGVVWCSILAGGFVIALGLARMGNLIRFIPFPVVTGFTTGIALLILTSQIKDLFGLDIDELPREFLEKWYVYATHLNTINPWSMVIGLGTIGSIAMLRRFAPAMPPMLAALILSTLATEIFHLPINTVGSLFGDLPRTLPSPSLPTITWEQLRMYTPLAFTVGMLAAIESLLSATVADGMTGDHHDPDTELIAVGVANIACPIFGGIPATGAIARTAANIKSGARTPVSGIVHALVLLAILFFLAPLAKAVPLAALAGILTVVSWNMSEIHQVKSLLRAPRSDIMVLLTTFALTVLVDLTIAIEVGIVLASLLFIRRMGEVTNVSVVTNNLFHETEDQEDALSIKRRKVPHGVEVYEVEGAFFFGAADAFEETRRHLNSPAKVLILRLRHVLAIDATGLHHLETLSRTSKRNGTVLILSGVRSQPLTSINKKGLGALIGKENMTPDIDSALRRAGNILAETNATSSNHQ